MATTKKITLTARELFKVLENSLKFGRADAGEIVDIAWTSDDDCGVASYKWDGLHFHGEDSTSILMHYGNEPYTWALDFGPNIEVII